MPAGSSSGLGPGFDREEVSAILHRAIVVASDRHEVDDDRLTAKDLAAVASEVGVPPAALATALAEARAGAEQQRRRIDRLVDRLVGPSRVWSSGQVVDDDREAAAPSRREATEDLRRWLEVDHGLATYVRDDGVVIASRRGGVTGAIGSGVRRLQGTGGLHRARSVRAAAASVERHEVVCIVADVGNRRTEAIVGGTAVAGSSAAALGVVAVVAGPLVLIGLPVAAVFGVGTARLAHRRTLQQVGDQVEQTTHAVARQVPPLHPVERVLRSGLGRRGRRREARGRPAPAVPSDERPPERS